uniref:Macaca fascicularis brain cDNA clone: QflA-21914, similar to human KCCR13L (LOC221955), mRNA, RefSeq: NM_139179.1 n=1 Tax=Macaca fascicularis TaxID=9541 RepID=I7G757_MACFA|nr:unnamed protein product [Macaca fascicularis]
MIQASYLMASRQQRQACGKPESSSCAVALGKTTILGLLFRVRQSFSQPTFQTQIWCPVTLRRASPCFISNRTISGTTRSLPRWSATPQGAPRKLIWMQN